MTKLQHLKIVFKGILKNNKANKMLLTYVTLLFLIPTLLYGVTQSISKQTFEQKRLVFGSFTDIYYQYDTSGHIGVSKSDIESLLPDFQYETFGSIKTVYREAVSENKMLNIGWLDQEAIKLSCLSMVEGTFPKNNGEIALSKSIASYYGKSMGDTIHIAKCEYSIVGIFSDYGVLWPKGEEEMNNKVSPVNAFITQNKAEEISKNSKDHIYRQILLKRNTDLSNGLEDSANFYQNSNMIDNENSFNIPEIFKVFLYIISLLVLFSILFLNRENLLKRLRIYYSLGMDMKHVLSFAKCELNIIIISGFIIGTLTGFILIYFFLYILAIYINITPMIIFDIRSNIFLYSGILIGAFILNVLNVNTLKNKILNGNDSNKFIAYPFRKTKISLLKFDMFIGKKYMALTIMVICLTITFLTYGIYYGFYFKADSLSLAPGYIPRDYDYQFVSTIQPDVPLDSLEDGKEHSAVFFTDTYEKIGASSKWVDQLSRENSVERIVPYKENTKMNLLLKKGILDKYLQGYDEVFNLQQLTNISDQDKVYKHYGYNSDDVLVNSMVVGYTPDSLKYLERSVVEGEINMDKISKGEEIVLRVPAYEFVTKKLGDIESKGIMAINPEDRNAINSELLKVGDEITLSGILTNEKINGGVEEYMMKQFYRHDVKVKIGAIIRTNDGELPTAGNSSAFIYSILTTNDALDKLGISSDYSVISVYIKPNTDNNMVRDLMYSYSNKVPDMTLEDWQEEVLTYRIYNILVAIFASIIVVLLIIVSFILIVNQLFIKTRLSLPIYSLYRINGLHYKKISRIWLLQVFGCFVGGSILSLPCTVAVFMLTMKFSFSELIQHFNSGYFSIGYIAIFIILCITILICRKIIVKVKNNILDYII